MGEIGKDFLPPFLESIDRRNCNYGSRELIPMDGVFEMWPHQRTIKRNFVRHVNDHFMYSIP